ncbi:MAG: hypothetical protein Q7S46_06480 [Gallionella sp.]|nr:hypothetical protein [Gallionella sp.]
MLNIILMTLLAVASSSAMAEWVKVTTSNIGISGDITAYADTVIIPKYSDRVKMWEMYDSKRFNSSNTSSKKRVEYDCRKGQARQLQATYYSEGMGKGAVLMSVSDPGQWEPILSGTVNKEMWKFACKNR